MKRGSVSCGSPSGPPAPSQEADAVERVGEAVAKAVVCALKSEDDPDDWLNPTEVTKQHQPHIQHTN